MASILILACGLIYSVMAELLLLQSSLVMLLSSKVQDEIWAGICGELNFMKILQDILSFQTKQNTVRSAHFRLWRRGSGTSGLSVWGRYCLFWVITWMHYCGISYVNVFHRVWCYPGIMYLSNRCSNLFLTRRVLFSSYFSTANIESKMLCTVCSHAMLCDFSATLLSKSSYCPWLGLEFSE